MTPDQMLLLIFLGLVAIIFVVGMVLVLFDNIKNGPSKYK
jgi:hypothetical protein